MVKFIKLSFIVLLSLATFANGFTTRFTQWDPTKSVLQVQPREFVKRNAGADIESQETELGPAETLPPLKPDIYSFHIHSDIRYRYCRTNIVSRVANPNSNNSTEIKFQVILPDSAFISKFFMEIDGKTYEAYVKEKEKAKQVYTEAKQRGQTAGLVEINARDSNVFNVNVNVKAKSKITFNFTYEELLIRKFGHYEHAINVNSEEISKFRDYTISVSILESQNISLLRIPKLINDLEQITDTTENNTDVNIERRSGKSVNITWVPSELDKIRSQNQRRFVVQYDLDRNSDAGEILLMNGYFVHFFTPRNVLALRKHVVFTLDLSGSMDGQKIVQLKEAMLFILDDLKPDDYFNILTFSYGVNVWTIGNQTNQGKRYPLVANEYNVRKARQFVTNLRASGLTNIHDALKESLAICQAVKPDWDTLNNINEDTTNADENGVQKLPPNVESTIIFLTDGEPTVGLTNPESIITSIKNANANLSIPIYSLAFGNSADFNFVKKLSLQNKGFARKIYEASDADLQLKGFYKEISSPLLSNITFKYTSDNYTVTKLTTNKFTNMFGGSEIAIAGRFKPKVQEISSTTTTTVPSVTPGAEENYDYDVSQVVKYLFMPIIAVDVEANGRDGLVSYDHNDIIEKDISVAPSPTLVPSPAFNDENTNNATATTEYTAHPTEDIFLEKLWAYLMIRQLIDKGLADEVEVSARKDDEIDSPVYDLSEESPAESQEEPKSRALRLALKYGFVTPLTSLIVVKPNDTVDNWARRETDEPSNLGSLVFPSFTITTTAAPARSQIFTSSITNGISSHVTARRAGGSGAGLGYGRRTSYMGARYGGGGGGGGYGGGGGMRYGGGGGFSPSSATTVSSISTVTSSGGVTTRDDRSSSSQSGTTFSQMIERMRKQQQEEQSRLLMQQIQTFHEDSERQARLDRNLDIQRERDRGMQRQLDTVRLSNRRFTTTSPNRSNSTDSTATKELLKISWYYRGRDGIYVNGTKFTIAQPNTVCSSCSPYECNVKNSTLSGIDAKGECKHLKDCVMDEFGQDISVYTQSYFCPLRSPHGWIKYAGVCCPPTFRKST